MTTDIQLTDTKLDYLSLADARQRSGLRLILGAYTIPGPWREACKGLFHVKRIPYLRVRSAGAGRDDVEFGAHGADRELVEWTGQASAPVAIWNDERPCTSWLEQLCLAERLQPDPPLLPDNVEERALMIGLCHELCGEHGFAWSKRLAIVHRAMANLAPDSPDRPFWLHVAKKYRYSDAEGAAAPARIAQIVRALARQLERQYDAGRSFFTGTRLSALDIYWTTFVTMLDPLPPALCPMATVFRGLYSNPDPEVRDALSPLLLAHRDFIYRSYLELPVVF